uniref:TATA box-binding protein-associated factor RNA polymerase I subunit B n=1 Tax=Setaria digitata TaxID=48799 RepID=A0A915Q2Z8_9BILA
MSQYCRGCGSTDFTPVDGFFYCTVCGTQSQILREFDHDDESGLVVSRFTRIRRKKSPAVKGERENKASEEITSDEEKRLPALRQDFPAYLGHGGLRLATFTKLLSRFSASLIRDFGIPECVKEHVLNILQHYLQHFHVAFCDEELDEEDPFCPLVKNEEYEAQKKAKVMKAKMQKEAQLRSGENLISLLSSAEIKSNLDVQVVDVDTDDLQDVIEQRTKISKEAFSTLLRIPMSVEIIMVILYFGCLLSGASWVLLSDITRWFREGRFPMSLFQRAALIVAGKGNDIFDLKGLSFCPKTPTMPLHEYMRTTVVVAQITGIPPQPVPCFFERVLVRLSYNLNLPTDFMQHLQTVFVVSSPNVIFDALFTRRFNIIDSKALLEKANSTCCDNIGFALEQNTYQTEERSCRPYSIIPSVEVKAVAIILFALKLVFGLDDSTEFNMKTKCIASSGNDKHFDFGVWLHQLKMRMNVWRGRCLKDVLGNRTTAFPSYDSVIENYRMVTFRENYRGEQVSQIRGSRLLGGRNLYFKGCVPSNFIMEECDYPLFTTFEDDFDLSSLRSLEKEALLTPLRHQAIHNLEWYEALENSAADDFKRIDRYNSEVFFKSFENYRMEYEAAVPLQNRKVLKSEGSCCSDAARMKFRQLFPCSEHYESYPRPLYCPGLVQLVFDSFCYTPIIYTSGMMLLVY